MFSTLLLVETCDATVFPGWSFSDNTPFNTPKSSSFESFEASSIRFGFEVSLMESADWVGWFNEMSWASFEIIDEGFWMFGNLSSGWLFIKESSELFVMLFALVVVLLLTRFATSGCADELLDGGDGFVKAESNEGDRDDNGRLSGIVFESWIFCDVVSPTFLSRLVELVLFWRRFCSLLTRRFLSTFIVWLFETSESVAFRVFSKEAPVVVCCDLFCCDEVAWSVNSLVKSLKFKACCVLGEVDGCCSIFPKAIWLSVGFVAFSTTLLDDELFSYWCLISG